MNFHKKPVQTLRRRYQPAPRRP